MISNYKDDPSSFSHYWHSHHSSFQIIEKDKKINKNRECRNCWFCAWRNGTRMPVLTCSTRKAAPCVEVGRTLLLPHQGLSSLVHMLPGVAPNTALLRNEGLLGHHADHVVKDAFVVEISELHVRVKPHDRLKGFPRIQLQQRSREESLWKEFLPNLPSGRPFRVRLAHSASPTSILELSAGPWNMPSLSP